MEGKGVTRMLWTKQPEAVQLKCGHKTDELYLFPKTGKLAFDRCRSCTAKAFAKHRAARKQRLGQREPVVAETTTPHALWS
jgi:hypothetical protein